MMLQNNSQPDIESLLPRRQEIVSIVRDHPYISFDAIARRFPSIPRRTLSYDVMQLARQHYIQKHGITRGACYTALKAEKLTAL